MMRRIMYTNLINIILSFLYIFCLSSYSLRCIYAPWGPAFLLLPRMHLSEIYSLTIEVAFTMLHFYTMLHLVRLKEPNTFLHATFSLDKTLSLFHKRAPLHLLPSVNLILLFYFSKVTRAGRDWLNECSPFKISISGNSITCF